MSEQVEETQEDTKNETSMNMSMVTFDIYRILKEFSNISNLVTTEEFLETVPKLRGVKWVQLFNCVKQNILNEKEQEMSSMWVFENMPRKLEILENQKAKYAETNPNNTVWRPQHNVKHQLRAFDAASLRKQKALLISLVEEIESKATRLRRFIGAKRVYFKALQMDIQKYKKKNEEIVTKINEKFKCHGTLVDLMYPNKVEVNDIGYSSDSGVEE
ncbi:uncharacterized protein LOC112056035 [Bicyclus anynana]|uniref:Uncharacterized protein LOC112056035 n=1 Tax=Bicyclus anynana TaxID=110368 RepID=A0ABM3LSM0_BICAN|nr:uncharacterized protein LOC112056035 [Bicyclus anynana]